MQGLSRCAEEDSNLHPVIPDQALNLARLPIPPSARGLAQYSLGVTAAPAAGPRRTCRPCMRASLDELQRQLAERVDAVLEPFPWDDGERRDDRARDQHRARAHGLAERGEVGGQMR